MRFWKVALTAAGLLLLAQTAWAKIDTVKMQDFEFVPASLTIFAGDTVVWKSIVQCCIQHTTTRTSTPMTWNATVPLNSTFRLAFNQTGTFNYVCTPHAGLGMTGSITVQPPPPPVTALGWLGFLFLAASLTAAALWMLEGKRTVGVKAS